MVVLGNSGGSEECCDYEDEGEGGFFLDVVVPVGQVLYLVVGEDEDCDEEGGDAGVYGL